MRNMNMMKQGEDGATVIVLTQRPVLIMKKAHG